MRKRQILRVVSTYDSLDLDELRDQVGGVEIQDFTESNLSPDQIEEITAYYKEALADFKGVRAMHGPFMDLKPASPDNEIRQLSMEKYIRALRLGAELKMDYVIFHSQINPDLNEDFIRSLNNQQNAQAWKEILDQAQAYQGIILIENVFEKDPYILKELLDEIDRDNIRLNLDIGHVNLSGVELEEWVRVLKDYLVYSHVHTNDGIFDQHRPITREKLEAYFRILDKYQLSPLISLEYKFLDLAKELEDLSL